MKWLAALAIAAALTFGVALGQTEQTDATPWVEGPWGKSGELKFSARPNGADFASAYPAVALERSMGGAVVLCCKARPDRTLDCRVGAEWPPAEWKFGEASLRIARKFELSPESLALITSHPDAELRLPIQWNIEDSGDRRYNKQLRAANDRLVTTPICRGDRLVSPT